MLYLQLRFAFFSIPLTRFNNVTSSHSVACFTQYIKLHSKLQDKNLKYERNITHNIYIQKYVVCSVYINQRDAQILVNNLYFFLNWLYMFWTIISPSSGATFNKLYSAIGTFVPLRLDLQCVLNTCQNPEYACPRIMFKNILNSRR